MKTPRAPLLAGMAMTLPALAGACFSHKVESTPIEIKPIYITMDINLRVQRELDEFFDFEESSQQAPPPSNEQTGKE
jgi:hypothetical protein